MKVIEKGGKAVGLMQVREEDEIVMITNSGKLIRTTADNISLLVEIRRESSLWMLTQKIKSSA